MHDQEAEFCLPFTLYCPYGHGMYQACYVDEECPACADGMPAEGSVLRASYRSDLIEQDLLASAESDIAEILFYSTGLGVERSRELAENIVLKVLEHYRKDLVYYEAEGENP